MVKRSKSFLQEPSEIMPKAVMTMVCWTLTVAVWLPFPFPVKKLQALLIIILLALGFSQKMLTVYINFLTVISYNTFDLKIQMLHSGIYSVYSAKGVRNEAVLQSQEGSSGFQLTGMIKWRKNHNPKNPQGF